MSQVRQHTVRLPSDLFERLEMRAVFMHRSINKEIEALIEAALNNMLETDSRTAQAMQLKVV